MWQARNYPIMEYLMYLGRILAEKKDTKPVTPEKEAQ